MFDKNFYPTPREVVIKMLGYDIDFRHKRILEPSAGKGDILDYIANDRMSSRYNNQAKDRLYCIEKNQELQQILRGKNYKLIHDDFLNYEPDYIFDYIIMNPPFSEGAKHLLKAWDISRGAEIICLLNAETYNNPCTKERALLKIIIDEHGTVEELGQCFQNAERKSNVDVILIKLKDVDYKSDFNFTGDKLREEYISETKEYNLANLDEFQNLEDCFNKVKLLSEEIIKLTSQMDHYGRYFQQRQLMSEELATCTEGSKTETYNKFIAAITKTAWDGVINNTKMHDKITTKARQDFQKSQEQQGQMAFTYENIVRFYEDLFYNQSNIMQKCVEEAFDLMTRYHKENRCHIEGWKTNDKWQVNKKVILPNMRDNWGVWKISGQAKDKICDIQKGLCFITGKKIEAIESIEKSINKENVLSENKRTWEKLLQTNTWYDSEFFEFKVFLKGTMHLKFKDDELYKKFNLTACKMKNWLKGE